MSGALVQANAAAAASVAYTTANLTAGNTLLAVAANNTTGLTFTCSDGTNGAWTAIAGTKFNTTFGSVQWFQFTNTAGGVKPTVTIASSGTAAASIVIHEVSGLANPFTVDGANTNEGTSATPTVSVTVGTTGDFVIGYCEPANTATVGTGFTIGGNDGNGCISEYQASAASGALNVVFNQTSGLFLASAFAAKPTGAATSIPDLIMAPPHR